MMFLKILYNYRKNMLEKELSDKLAELLQYKHDIKVFTYISDISYAYATKEKSICLTTSLLNKLTKKEVESVMLHEASHIINDDSKLRFCMDRIIPSLMVSLFMSVSFSILYIEQNNIFAYIYLFFMCFCFIGSMFHKKIYDILFGRRNELRCDLFASKKGYDNSLISALRKIEPKGKKYRFYDSHPSLNDRIKNIRRFK